MYALFSWLPAVRTKRHYQMKLFLEVMFGEKMTSFQGFLPDGIDAFIDGLIAQVLKEQAVHQQQIDLAEDVSQRENEAAIRWREINHSLGNQSEAELSLCEADELADT